MKTSWSWIHGLLIGILGLIQVHVGEEEVQNEDRRIWSFRLYKRFDPLFYPLRVCHPLFGRWNVLSSKLPKNVPTLYVALTTRYVVVLPRLQHGSLRPPTDSNRTSLFEVIALYPKHKKIFCDNDSCNDQEYPPHAVGVCLCLPSQ